ncbi:hypothetical protein [Sphingomonas cavernae]|uniref:hypothetical protein n=1 Tax=Sphingomonas cavernae TaxID=2320861 RepID=UPI0011C3899E|nr:hypothetical protein [Sphingomonas cavernae]
MNSTMPDGVAVTLTKLLRFCTGRALLMGKRNLAIVGTHRDFFADILDENAGVDPSIITGCASPEDAATSYFKDIFEGSNARIQAAVVLVWPVDAGTDKQLVFDARAILTPCEEPDAEPEEYDVFLDIQERI